MLTDPRIDAVNAEIARARERAIKRVLRDALREGFKLPPQQAGSGHAAAFVCDCLIPCPQPMPVEWVVDAAQRMTFPNEAPPPREVSERAIIEAAHAIGLETGHAANGSSIIYATGSSIMIKRYLTIGGPPPAEYLPNPARRTPWPPVTTKASTT